MKISSFSLRKSTLIALFLFFACNKQDEDFRPIPTPQEYQKQTENWENVTEIVNYSFSAAKGDVDKQYNELINYYTQRSPSFKREESNFRQSDTWQYFEEALQIIYQAKITQPDASQIVNPYVEHLYGKNWQRHFSQQEKAWEEKLRATILTKTQEYAQQWDKLIDQNPNDEKVILDFQNHVIVPSENILTNFDNEIQNSTELSWEEKMNLFGLVQEYRNNMYLLAEAYEMNIEDLISKGGRVEKFKLKVNVKKAVKSFAKRVVPVVISAAAGWAAGAATAWIASKLVCTCVGQAIFKVLGTKLANKVSIMGLARKVQILVQGYTYCGIVKKIIKDPCDCNPKNYAYSINSCAVPPSWIRVFTIINGITQELGFEKLRIDIGAWIEKKISIQNTYDVDVAVEDIQIPQDMTLVSPAGGRVETSFIFKKGETRTFILRANTSIASNRNILNNKISYQDSLVLKTKQRIFFPNSPDSTRIGFMPIDIEVKREVSVTIDNQNFGTAVNTTPSIKRKITFTNLSQLLTNIKPSIPNGFELLDENGQSISNIYLKENQTRQLTLQMPTAVIGQKDGQISFLGNFTNTLNPISISGKIDPIIRTLAVQNVDIGEMANNFSYKTPSSITNTGNMDITITSFGEHPNISVLLANQTLPVVLKPNESLPILVQFNSKTEGKLAANMTINSNATNNATIQAKANVVNYVSIYVHCDYDGFSLNLTEGDYTLDVLRRQRGFPDNSLSSFKIPKGFIVTFFENDNFGGKNITKGETQSCFNDKLSGGIRPKSWNDATSSLIVQKIK